MIRVRDSRTEWLDVARGINMKDGVEIFGDLEEGDELVLRANDKLKTGQPVSTPNSVLESALFKKIDF